MPTSTVSSTASSSAVRCCASSRAASSSAWLVSIARRAVLRSVTSTTVASTRDIAPVWSSRRETDTSTSTRHPSDSSSTCSWGSLLAALSSTSPVNRGAPRWACSSRSTMTFSCSPTSWQKASFARSRRPAALSSSWPIGERSNSRRCRCSLASRMRATDSCSVTSRMTFWIAGPPSNRTAAAATSTVTSRPSRVRIRSRSTSTRPPACSTRARSRTDSANSGSTSSSTRVASRAAVLGAPRTCTAAELANTMRPSTCTSIASGVYSTNSRYRDSDSCRAQRYRRGRVPRQARQPAPAPGSGRPRSLSCPAHRQEAHVTG